MSTMLFLFVFLFVCLFLTIYILGSLELNIVIVYSFLFFSSLLLLGRHCHKRNGKRSDSCDSDSAELDSAYDSDFSRKVDSGKD